MPKMQNPGNRMEYREPLAETTLHARTGQGACAMHMQNMTFHDISHGVPPARMTKHDIP